MTLPPPTRDASSKALDAELRTANSELRTPNSRFFSFDSPEAALLFAAARQEGPTSTQLAAVIDWPLLIEAAEREGMIGLLEASLRGAAIPAAARSALKHRTFLHHARALTMLHQLQRVLSAFEAEGIPIMTFKGAVLAQQLYDDRGVRLFGDLDVIVAPADADRGETVLRRLGYDTGEQLTTGQLRDHRRFNSETAFTHKQHGTVVDYHWSFTNVQFRFDLSFDEAWRKRTVVSIDNFPFPTLGDAHLALLTANHAAKHRWSTLEGLASIASLQRLTVDWSAVEQEATNLRILRQLGLSFLLVQRIVQAPIPELPHAYAAAEPSLPVAEAWVQDALFSRSDRNVHAGGRDLLHLLDRRIDVARALSTAIFAPTFTDWKAMNLPAPLYWLLRPVRLLAKYAKLRIGN